MLLIATIPVVLPGALGGALYGLARWLAGATSVLPWLATPYCLLLLVPLQRCLLKVRCFDPRAITLINAGMCGAFVAWFTQPDSVRGIVFCALLSLAAGASLAFFGRICSDNNPVVDDREWTAPSKPHSRTTHETGCTEVGKYRHDDDVW